MSFFKTKLVSHSIKVRSHCNFLKAFLAYVVKIMEVHVKKVSNFRCAIHVSDAAVRQWLEILINRFFIKKLSVGGGGYILAGGGWWWWMVVSRGWWHSLV